MMKRMKLNNVLVVLVAAGMMALLSSGSCGGDDSPVTPSGAGGDGTGGGGGHVDPVVNPDADDPSARALTVSIDESGLTYEDLTIHLSTTDYHFTKVPFGTVKVSIEDLPVSLAELKKLKLPAGMTDIHQSPYLQPILLVAAINQMDNNKTMARAMLDYVAKGCQSENRDAKLVHFPSTTPVTEYYKSDWNQLNQYISWKKVRSYLEGALYGNNFTPVEKPYVMTMTLTDYSYTADPDYVQLWVKSPQKSSPNEIGVWKYDSNSDGEFDYFFCTTYLGLIHSLGEYKTE
jgi:hypothetical protein